MKSIALAAIFFAIPVLASAQNLGCATERDATYSVAFSHIDSELMVALTIRDRGVESTYHGSCHHDEGAIESAITCDVSTTRQGSYIVRLFSVGSRGLYASLEGGILFQAVDLGPVLNFRSLGTRDAAFFFS